MAHHKEQNVYNKKKKRSDQYKIIVLFLIILLMLVSGNYYFAIATALLAYLLHELLWSDHIFYNTKQDYQHNLKADSSETIDLSDYKFTWKDDYNNKTLMLELDLKSTISGYLLDPYVILSADSLTQKQFFERNLSGKRFLNLSHITPSSTVSLKFKHCQLNHNHARLHVFSNPDLSAKKIMFISPHADDAEIAAYGLYSQHNSFIATITAGEVKAEAFEASNTTPEEASRLKGRLRAWDSLAAPRWAGLNQDSAINLGYFCLTLEQMKNNPEEECPSLSAGISDTRFFRSLNTVSLQSNKNGTSNWITLVEDLRELITSVKPDIIVTAHPLLDPHKDHFFSTLACVEACEIEGCHPDFLLYANHYNHTDMFPFGLSGSLASLPPEFTPYQTATSVFSYGFDNSTQRDKTAALGMMHDLTQPIRFKKRIRQTLQNLFIGREHFQFGNDDYFRKAVRQNELFFKASYNQLILLLKEK